ncbi:MAG TPA: hypothetical protein VGB83_09890 [Actinomycetota bacterium]
MTGFDEYWMGKGLDADAVWGVFESGRGYVAKVESSTLYLLRLTFEGHPTNLPLFDFEAIYKTVKGTFHDVKAECFAPSAYDSAAPIFLHRVDRGSGIFEFLGQLDPVLTWVVALGGASVWYRRILREDQNFDDSRLRFLRENFPNASPDLKMAYMQAWSTFARRRALHKMMEQDLRRVEVSQEPHSTSASEAMVDVEPLIQLKHDGDV